MWKHALDIIDEGTDLDVGFVTKSTLLSIVELFNRPFSPFIIAMIMIESLKTEFDCEVLFSAFEAFSFSPLQISPL